jgi:hypothetical protein
MRSRHRRNPAGPLAGASSKAFAGQRVALAGEQQAGRRSRHGRGSRAAGRRDCPTCVGKPPAPVPRNLFPLFYLVEIRHRQLRQSQSRTRSQVPMSREYNVNMAIT